MPKGKGYSSPKGMYSHSGNPVPSARKVPRAVGPGGNSDQAKANRMLQMAQRKVDSQRGKSGM